MKTWLFFDRIQFFSILFSFFIFFFIFWLVKNRKMKEEYALLWFLLSLFLIYMALDRHAIDRLGALVGVAYSPSVLLLLTTGFTFLMLIHLSVVISRLAEQNKELLQEMGLQRCEPAARESDLLVIVPAYNEAENIAGVLADLESVEPACDILVVNDGSRDETSRLARESGRARVVDLPKNLGIGGAVQTGFKYALRNGYPVAIQFDGDGQHAAGEIPHLLRVMREQRANLVIGSRFLAQRGGYRSTFARRLGIGLFRLVNSWLIGQRVTDNTSGFRAYDRRALALLAGHYPTDYPEPEAVILLGKNGLRIAEVPVVMHRRQGGDSSIAGLTGIYYMFKVLLAILMTALRRPLIDGSPQKRRTDDA